MKTTVEIPKHAAEQRITLRALIERCLRRELADHAPSPKAKRPVIRWVTVPGGLPKGMDASDRGKMLGRPMK
jgi:hypothetical protein